MGKSECRKRPRGTHDDGICQLLLAASLLGYCVFCGLFAANQCDLANSCDPIRD